MKFIIDTDVLGKYNMSLTEFMRLYSLRTNKGNDVKDISSLKAKGFIENNVLVFEDGMYTFDSKSRDIMAEIIQKSLIVNTSERSIENWDYKGVWAQVKEMYPRGKMTINGNNGYPWRISSPMFKKRMQYMFRELDTIYTEREVIDAFREYTTNPPEFMRVMAYFIYNHDRQTNEFNSDLSTVIECGLEGINDSDWTTELI